MKWWLVTWSTYAAWLPGDPRGFQTWRGKEYVPPPKRYAKPGEATYDARKYTDRYRAAKASADPPVKLSPVERQSALDTVVEKLAELPVNCAVMAAASEHCHLLAKFGGLKIRLTVGFLKAAATKKLHANGFSRSEPWGKECHMKSKAEGREFRTAFDYVYDHANEGAAVYVWPEFRYLLK